MSLFNQPSRRLFLLSTLAACGFEPVINSESYKALWGKVNLPEAKTSNEFTIRRVLATYFGEPQNPIYNLEFKYTSKTSSLAITQNSVVTRYRLTATGRFIAYRIGIDTPILDQDFKRIASYSANKDRFASDEAKQTTETRLIRSLGDDFAYRFINAVSLTDKRNS